MATAATKDLTDLQKAFVRHYCDCLDAGEAARLAGYSAKTAYSMGPQLRKDPRIRAAIDREFEETSKGKGEVKRRIEHISESSMELFLRIEGDEDSETVSFSFAGAKRARKLGLIRDITITKRTLPGDAGGTETKIRLKVADPMPALKALGKHHGILENEKTKEEAEDDEDGDSDSDTAIELAKLDA